MMRHFLAISLLFIIYTINTNAQFQRIGSYSGLQLKVMEEGGMSLSGAHITLTSDKDSIRLTTDENGFLNYNKHLADSILINISYIGYESLHSKIKSQASYNVFLKEKEFELSEVIVKGDIIAVITKGDTVQFNASAYKTIDGDSMSKLFEKLPGMTLDEGELKYRGERIDRITVDKQRLFGENVLLALDNIKADNVVNVKVYKEDTDWAKSNEIKDAKQLTVADVTTHSKPQRIKNIILSVTAGAETDVDSEERKILYETLGKTVYSRTGETMTSDINIRNINIPNFSYPPRYETRDIGGGLNYYRHKPKFLLSLDTKLNTRRDASESWERNEYFPSEDFLSRNYYIRSLMKGKRNDVTSRNLWRNMFKDKSALDINLNFTYSDDITKITDTVSTTYNNVLAQNQKIVQHEKSNIYNLETSLSYSKVFKTNIRTNIATTAIITEGNGDGWRVDTLESSTSQIHLNNTNSRSGRIYKSKINTTFPLKELLSFALEDELEYIDTQSQRTSLDVFTQTVDINNTHDYKIHELNNMLSGKLEYRDNEKEKGLSTTSLLFKWINKDLQRDEHFPEEYKFPRTFNFLNINAQIEYKLTQFNKLNLQYSRTNSQFNILDLRETLDDTNPIILRYGNSSLKIPMQNSLRIESSFLKNPSTYGFVINFSIYENPIVNKERYFTSDTYIPKFDYMIPAGSSLITKENMNSRKILWTEGSYNRYLKKIKSVIDTRLSYSYEDNPAYINERPATITVNKYKASMKIIGNFSSSFEPSLWSSSEYWNIYNGLVRNRGFTQIISLNMRSLISKDWEIMNENNLEWNLRWPQVIGIDHFGIISTLSLGYKLNTELTAKVTAYDLFNKRTRFTSNTYPEYISTSYTRKIGRYFLLGVEWKF